MSNTEILDIELLQANSASPEAPVNEAIEILERAANATVEWTITGDVQPTKAQMAAGFFHELNGSPSAPFAFGIPAVARHFAVINDSGQTCTVYVQGLSGGGVSVADGETVTLRSDGANVEEVGGSSGAGMQLIEQKSLSGLSTVAFTSIPQTYSHLLVVVRGRSTAGSTPGVNVNMTFNNDAGSNYDIHGHQVINASEGDNGVAAQAGVIMGFLPFNAASAGYRGFGRAYVWDYTNSTGYKNGEFLRSSMGNTSKDGTWVTGVQGFGYRSETPITRLDLTLAAGNGTADSKAWLYGIP